jgi:hypothetical protein
MKRISILILLLMLALSACGRTPATLAPDAPADNVPSIIGEYAVNGFDPMKEEYGGRLTITAGDNPNEYKMQWIISGGIHAGVGILEGNQLKVTWEVLTGPVDTVTGTGAYTVTVNGELYGTRSIDGTEPPGTETAYPNPEQ